MCWRHSTPRPERQNMKLNVAVQMDPIARINIRGDSTFALLLEAQKRGHGLSYYTPDKLSLVGDELVAPVQVLAVRDEPGDHFTLGEPKREPLANFDVILLRQGPPLPPGRPNGGAPAQFRRHIVAAGPAIRPRLHHLDPFSGAAAAEDTGHQ